MPESSKIWLDAAKEFACQFIERHYPSESAFFESFWSVVVNTIDQAVQSLAPGQNLTRGQMVKLTHQAFTGDQAMDLVTPIVIATLTVLTHEIKQAPCTSQQLQDRVEAIAADHGASPSLIACLRDHLPSLYQDLQKRNDSPTALINRPEPQYHIWTEGKHLIVTDITEYEQRKAGYLLWVDLAKQECQCLGRSPQKIGGQSMKLLVYMVEHLGVQVSFKQIDAELYKTSINDDRAIEQQLSKMQKLTRKQFRNYLFPDHKAGFGLKDDFKDQYFIFKRMR